jgi:hypothetical protein
VSRPKTKNPTFGLVSEVGCLRFELSFPYRAIPPHNGALLQLQQRQTPIMILWLTGYTYHTAAKEKVNSRSASAMEQHPGAPPLGPNATT